MLNFRVSLSTDTAPTFLYKLTLSFGNCRVYQSRKVYLTFRKVQGWKGNLLSYDHRLKVFQRSWNTLTPGRLQSTQQTLRWSIRYSLTLLWFKMHAT